MTRPTLILFLIFGAFSLPRADDAVSVLQQEIDRIAGERDQARKEFLTIQTEAETHIRSLSSSQVELSGRLQQADRKLLALEAEAGRSAMALQRAEAEIDRRGSALEELQAELERNRLALEQQLEAPAPAGDGKDVENLREVVAEQEREMAALRGAMQAAMADRQLLDDLNKELQQEVIETRRSESLATAKLAALESRLDNLNQELERLYQERSELEQEQQRMQAEIADLQKQLADAMANRVPREEVEALTATLESLQAENRDLRRQVETQADIPDLREAFATLETERNQLQKQQQSLTNEVADLEASLTTERAKTRDERERRRALEAQAGRDRQQRKALEKQIRRLESGLEAATAAGVEEAEMAEVHMLLADLQEENEILKQDSRQAREEAELLMAELNDSQSKQLVQIRDLQTMLGEQMIQLGESQRKIDALEAKTVTFDSMKSERNRLLKVRDDSRRDMKILARHIYELRDQLVESRTAETRLQQAGMEQQRLRGEIQKQERLTQALQAEQQRKDQQILDLRKRLAAERMANQADGAVE